LKRSTALLFLLRSGLLLSPLVRLFVWLQDGRRSMAFLALPVSGDRFLTELIRVTENNAYARSGGLKDCSCQSNSRSGAIGSRTVKVAPRFSPALVKAALVAQAKNEDKET
jgi:hypothetical protein